MGSKTKSPPDIVEKPPPPVFNDLGPNAPAFNDYLTQHMAYIQQVQGQLHKSLDDSLPLMDAQAREAEAHGSRMLSILSWADSYLDVAEHLALGKMPARDSTWTDLDRQKALAAAVARERRFRNVVRGLCESIERRVRYAQSKMWAFAPLERQRMQT